MIASDNKTSFGVDTLSILNNDIFGILIKTNVG